MRVLDFLNVNSGAFNVLFGLAVALATVFYALLTRRLVSETERMRSAQTDPHIAIRIEPSEAWINFILLVIENVGAGPAYDVRLTVSPEFEPEPGQPLSKLGVFTHGIPYMAPGQRHTHFLLSVVDAGPEIQDPQGRFHFTVTARYKNLLGFEQKSEYPINFLHLIGLSTIGRPPLLQIADDLERIQKSLGNLESGWRKMKVDVFTEADRRREASRLEDRRRARQYQRPDPDSDPTSPNDASVGDGHDNAVSEP